MRYIQFSNSLAVLAAMMFGSFIGCGGSGATPTTTDATTNGSGGIAPMSVEQVSGQVESGARRLGNAPAQDTQVRLRTSAGDILIRLYYDKAPRTVSNFLDYARDGFYDQTVVHHAQPGLVIAGGCAANMELKPTRFPILNEADNGLTHRRGTVAMARLPESANSATSQFFINLTDNPAFDHQGTDDARFGYCVFGEVISGMDVAEKIGKMQTAPVGSFSNVPQPMVVLEAVEDMAYLANQQDGTPMMR